MFDLMHTPDLLSWVIVQIGLNDLIAFGYDLSGTCSIIPKMDLVLEKWDLYFVVTRIQVSDPGPKDPLD